MSGVGKPDTLHSNRAISPSTTSSEVRGSTNFGAPKIQKRKIESITSDTNNFSRAIQAKGVVAFFQ